MGLLIPEVFIILLTDLIAALLLLYVTPLSFRIYSAWNMDSDSASQYLLEKKRLLASTIVKFIFMLKIPLFLFFIYANDKMSNVITGAMCAAGSISATPYGTPLLYIKIMSIFTMSAWLTVHHCNNINEKLPHTRLKYFILIIITVVTVFELILGVLNFSNIDPSSVVSCCSSIYDTSSEGSSFLMTLNPFAAFYIFIVISLLYFASIPFRKPKLTAGLATGFFFAGLLNLILFTSTYIYELPSHRCPFCILQREYMYIGYLFYISLFISVSGGINSAVFTMLTGQTSRNLRMISFIAALVFLLLSIAYPLRYFLVHNQWL